MIMKNFLISWTLICLLLPACSTGTDGTDNSGNGTGGVDQAQKAGDQYTIERFTSEEGITLTTGPYTVETITVGGSAELYFPLPEDTGWYSTKKPTIKKDAYLQAVTGVIDLTGLTSDDEGTSYKKDDVVYCQALSEDFSPNNNFYVVEESTKKELYITLDQTDEDNTTLYIVSKKKAKGVYIAKEVNGVPGCIEINKGIYLIQEINSEFQLGNALFYKSTTIGGISKISGLTQDSFYKVSNQSGMELATTIAAANSGTRTNVLKVITYHYGTDPKTGDLGVYPIDRYYQVPVGDSNVNLRVGGSINTLTVGADLQPPLAIPYKKISTVNDSTTLFAGSAYYTGGLVTANTTSTWVEIQSLEPAYTASGHSTGGVTYQRTGKSLFAFTDPNGRITDNAIIGSASGWLVDTGIYQVKSASKGSKGWLYGTLTDGKLTSSKTFGIGEQYEVYFIATSGATFDSNVTKQVCGPFNVRVELADGEGVLDAKKYATLAGTSESFMDAGELIYRAVSTANSNSDELEFDAIGIDEKLKIKSIKPGSLIFVWKPGELIADTEEDGEYTGFHIVDDDGYTPAEDGEKYNYKLIARPGEFFKVD